MVEGRAVAFTTFMFRHAPQAPLSATCIVPLSPQWLVRWRELWQGFTCSTDLPFRPHPAHWFPQLGALAGEPAVGAGDGFPRSDCLFANPCHVSVAVTMCRRSLCRWPRAHSSLCFIQHADSPSPRSVEPWRKCLGSHLLGLQPTAFPNQQYQYHAHDRNFENPGEGTGIGPITGLHGVTSMAWGGGRGGMGLRGPPAMLHSGRLARALDPRR